MTRLTKAVRRSSDATIRDGGKLRQLVVTLYPNDTIGLRPSKTRREEIVSLAAVYSLGVKQRVTVERAARIAKKKRS